VTSDERRNSDPKVIRVALLVTGHTRPKDLSRRLDTAFEDEADVLQFVVVVYGWPEGSDPTMSSLMEALVEDTAERLTDPATADEQGEGSGEYDH
jgi:hypothetical protein